ncbi:hypothetical protein KUA08_15660, partial [Komagataeibacter melomenusus]|uniref:hypothetical protein n=1 Tax=Komagataeibacter melomenusus TaxID=2766578 RepID=UPI0019D696CB
AKAQRFHFRPLGIRQYQAIHMQFKAHQGPCEKSIPNRPQKASGNAAFLKKGTTRSCMCSLALGA